MKIGILTFHWATNYGAVLQAFCLQEYLSRKGHNVWIINYRPDQYVFSWLRIAKNPGMLKKFSNILANWNKEKRLATFRDSFLNLTSRYSSVNELKEYIKDFDVLISGSDQVLNPSFTLTGDNGNPSSVYWLGIGEINTRKIGYSVSFGCEHYPQVAADIAKQWVNGLDAIGVREDTGLQILNQLGYNGMKKLLPDPTLLLGKDLFEKLGISIPSKKGDYTCVYMLRHDVKIPGKVYYIDEKRHPLSMEQWLRMIVNAKYLVTNSYHGMIMALMAHVPFAVLLETGRGSGMNDRFHTLLGRLNLDDRAVMSIEEALNVLYKSISFDEIEIDIEKYRVEGEEFLNEFLN